VKGLWAALVVATLATAAADSYPPVERIDSGGVIPLSIRVSGNHLVDGTGTPVRLLGVNRSGSEYSCVQDKGIFDGPSDAGSVSAIASWHVNAVRVPLNEDCWLGINGVGASYGGEVYQQAIAAYVDLLHRSGLYVILDLHVGGPSSSMATKSQVMPDADHSITFWRQVADRFKGDSALLFDLYSSPRHVSWGCWRDGAGCAVKWKVAGMQTLLNAVRATGARQPVILPGVGDGADNLTDWLSHEPVDPLAALVAGIHVFDGGQCDSRECWDGQLGSVAQKVPVVTTEAGSNGCSGRLLDSYTSWADVHDISYLAWAWTTWSTCHSLISKYNGSPANAFGRAYRDHLNGLFKRMAAGQSDAGPAPKKAAGTPTSRPATVGGSHLAGQQTPEDPWSLSASDVVPFLLGALVVLSALTTAASVMLALILLRVRRGGDPTGREAGGSLPVLEPELDDERGVEFYGPAPTATEGGDGSPGEASPHESAARSGRRFVGRRGRPATAR
jgi:endoglucanase